jgi:hypothetical protein
MSKKNSLPGFVLEKIFNFRSDRAFRLLGQDLGIGFPLRDQGSAPLEIFVTLGWWVSSFFRTRKRIDSVVVQNRYGRFGNQAIQLVNAVRICLAWGVGKVLAPRNTVFIGPSLSPHNRLDISTTTRLQPLHRKNLLSVVRSLFVTRAHLCGDFFNLDQVSSRKLSAVSISASYSILRSLGYSAAVNHLGLDHLVIHLRGGDIFRQNPHPLYGQPPLSFYEQVLALGLWGKCTVVYSDMKNPVLVPLLNLIRNKGLSLSVQSGPLGEDINFLLGAKHLVASRSTFVSSIVGLSHAIEKVFVFGADGFFIDCYREDIPLYGGLDLTGEYWAAVCEENWTHSPEQIALMLEYPGENIVIKKLTRPL